MTFLFNDTATTEFYTYLHTLSLPDALPIYRYFSTKAPKREKQSQKATGADRAALEDALPRSLEEQLAKERRDVLALHIAHDPALALDLTIFRLARKFTGHAAYNDTGVKIGRASGRERVCQYV